MEIVRMSGMMWIQVLIQTILDWLREIPPDILGRKVERFLDRSTKDRRRKARRGQSRGNRKLVKAGRRIRRVAAL